MKSIRSILIVVSSSFALVLAACSSSSDTTETPAGTGGAGGEASGGSGGTAAGGTSAEVDVSTCTLANAVDMTTDATVSINYKTGANAFDPPCVVVKVGTTVTLPTEMMHPLAGMVANGTQPNPITDAATAVTPPADGSQGAVPVTFAAAGTYGFYCKVHGLDMVGPNAPMSGGVYVTELDESKDPHSMRRGSANQSLSRRGCDALRPGSLVSNRGSWMVFAETKRGRWGRTRRLLQ